MRRATDHTESDPYDPWLDGSLYADIGGSDEGTNS